MIDSFAIALILNLLYGLCVYAYLTREPEGR